MRAITAESHHTSTGSVWHIATLLILMFAIISCKAQPIPEFAKVGDLGLEPSAEEYISWYNKTVVNPKYDTVTVFKMPEFSDLRYVIIRPMSSVARIEYTNGRFIGWLSKESQWIETVKFDEKGIVVKGMNKIMISSLKENALLVQYERCPTCVFKPNDKGKL